MFLPFFFLFNLACASVCGAGEKKNNPAASGKALADCSAMVHLSVLFLLSRSDFFQFIL